MSQSLKIDAKFHSPAGSPPVATPRLPWRGARWAASGALMLAAGAGAFWLLDLGATGTTLSALAGRPDLAALMAFTYTGAFVLRAEAWRLLAPQPGIQRFAILQAALFLNHLLPVKAGEFARPALAARQGMPMAAAATSTVVARLLDMGALALLAVVLLPFAIAPGAGLGIAAALLGPVAVMGTVLAAVRTAEIAPGWVPAKAAKLFEAGADGLRVMSPGRLAAAAAVTLPSWVLEAGILLGVAHAAGVDLAWHAAIAVTAVTIAFQVVHLTPGGLGIYEGTMTGALALYGVPPGEGLALAAAAHAVKFAYAFTVGAAALPFALRGAR